MEPATKLAELLQIAAIEVIAAVFSQSPPISRTPRSAWVSAPAKTAVCCRKEELAYHGISVVLLPNSLAVDDAAGIRPLRPLLSVSIAAATVVDRPTSVCLL